MALYVPRITFIELLSDKKTADVADDSYYNDPGMKNILDADVHSAWKLVHFAHKDLELESGGV